MTLLNEIRGDLTDQTSDISNILRKAMVLGHELNSAELREWAESEISGYHDPAKVPSYRRLNLPVYGTFHGPFQSRMPNVQIPTLGLPEAIRESLHHLVIWDGVAALQHMLASSDQELVYPLPPEATIALREHAQMTGGMQLFSIYHRTPTHLIAGILESVRAKLLSFVLDLQTEDVTPEGLKNGDVQPETIREAVHINIFGDRNIVAAGQNISQDIHPVREADITSLLSHFREQRISNQDLDILKKAITAEPTKVDGEIGPRVNAWIGNMIGKAVSGAWEVGLHIAPTILTTAIQRYYGN